MVTFSMKNVCMGRSETTAVINYMTPISVSFD